MTTTEQKDYYKALGVKRGSSSDEIRKAFRRLARKYHPDVNPGDKASEDRFKNVQEAYDILSDKKKRQMYDEFGFYSDAGPYGAAGKGAGPGGFDFSGFDFSDFTPGGARGARGQAGKESWGGFSDLFGQFFRPGESGAGPQAAARPGEDLEYTVDIGFWDAIRGSTIRLNIFRQENCRQCRGLGNIASGSAQCTECGGGGQVNQTVGAMKFNITCPRCQGKGELRNTCSGCGSSGRVGNNETVEVRIPAGAQPGSRLRVPGKGNAGHLGGPSGDLYIVTRVGSHPFFERKVDDIHIQVPVTIPEAILGGKIEVPTIDGRALLKIPPGTDSGKTFRLREKGVLNRRSQRRGDQFVEVKIVVPSIADEASKDLAREFARVNPEDPRVDLLHQE